MPRTFLGKFKLSVLSGVGMALAMPQGAFAAGKDLNWLIKSKFIPILNNVVMLIFALALVYFVWKMAHYVQGDKPQDAIQGMGWSLLAMFVMVSVWGLVKLIQNTFELESGQPTAPSFTI